METVNKTNEYITFSLDEEVYAIEVSGIESILEYTKLTKLPGTDDSVIGVLNLRGKALPVIDLRTIFNIRESGTTPDTAIIVMLIENEDKITAIGGLVDSVKEVIEITPDMIQAAPKVGLKVDNAFISGIAKHNDHFIIVLDINRVLRQDQLAIAEDENLLLLEDTEDSAETGK